MLSKTIAHAAALLSVVWMLGCFATQPPSPLASALRFPTFGLPPPDPTTKAELPPALVDGKTLGAAFDQLVRAAERAKLGDLAVYRTRSGFAVVTRLERIDEGGWPAARRFVVRDPALRIEGFRLPDYPQVLYNAPPGHYRAIVFLVAARNDAVLAEPIDPSDLEPGELPSELRGMEARPGGCTALVYRFSRPAAVGEPARLAEAKVPARLHLVRAGLWDPSELPPEG